MKRIIDTICKNAPCVMALMIGTSALVASQLAINTMQQVIEAVLGGALIGIAGYYWGRV